MSREYKSNEFVGAASSCVRSSFAKNQDDAATLLRSIRMCSIVRNFNAVATATVGQCFGELRVTRLTYSDRFYCIARRNIFSRWIRFSRNTQDIRVTPIVELILALFAVVTLYAELEYIEYSKTVPNAAT